MPTPVQTETSSKPAMLGMPKRAYRVRRRKRLAFLESPQLAKSGVAIASLLRGDLLSTLSLALWAHLCPKDKNYVPKFSYFAELYQSKVLKEWLQEDPANLDYFIDLVGKNKLLVTYKGVRSFAKIVASPIVIRTRAFGVLDKEDGDIEKAQQILESKGVTSKGLWGTVSKLHKSLGQTTYEEFAVALDDSSKLEMLDETITTLEGIRKNITSLKTKGEMS